MKKSAALLTALVLTLSGCGYAEEVNEKKFLIALGIDEGTEYNVRATFVFANPSDSGGEEGAKGSPGSDKSDILTVEAPGIFSAVKQLNRIIGKTIDMTHTKVIIFSGKTAKEGIGDYIYSFAAARDFRPNTYVCVSRCSAEKYLHKIKPSNEISLEKYFDLIMKKVSSDRIDESYLYYFYFNLADKTGGSIVPLVDINTNKLPDSSAEKNAADDFGINPKAGELVRKAENKTEVCGSAVFSGGKMVAEIGALSSDISKMIMGEFSSEYFTLRNPSAQKLTSVLLSQRSAPRIKTEIGDITKIRVTVPLNAKYVDSAPPSDAELAEFENYLSSVLSKKGNRIIKRAQTKYESDYFGFNEKLRSSFIDIPAWNSFGWNEKFKTADIKVKFIVQVTDFEELNSGEAMKGEN